MPYLFDRETARLIQGSQDVVANSRQIIAKSSQEREELRSVIRETRRVIDASRADRAKRDR